MKTGDVHAVVYDWANLQTYIAHGVTDENGEFIKQAHEEPFFRFDNEKLWNEAKPDEKQPAPKKQKDAVIPVDSCLVGHEVDTIVNKVSTWGDAGVTDIIELVVAVVEIVSCEFGLKVQVQMVEYLY